MADQQQHPQDQGEQDQDQSGKSQPGESQAELNKRRMREALDRKHAQQHPTEEAPPTDPSRGMHGVDGHIPAQMHRRKAGGGGA